MNANDFVSIDILLADILSKCADDSLKKGKSKGWYISQIEQAMAELAVDTFFAVTTKDYPIDKINLQLVIEPGLFNPRNIFVIQGTTNNIISSHNVHYKRNFNNLSGGTSYTSNVKDTGPTGPKPIYHNVDKNSNLYYANIENGVIMLSPSCASMDLIRITFNSFGGVEEIGDLPVVPRWFRQAVIAWVCDKFFLMRYAQTHDKADFALHQDYSNQLYTGSGRISNPGLWTLCIRRIKSMNTWTRNEILEHYHQMNF